MATEMNDDLKVDVEDTGTTLDEIATSPEVEKKADVEEKAPIPESEGIEELRRKLEAAEARARDNERVAVDLANRAQAEFQRAEQSDLQVIDAGISTIARENEILKANMQHYMRTQNYEKVAEIQEKLAENATYKRELEAGKQAAEAALRNAPKQPVTPPRSSDPVEAFASQLPQASADWIRKNPDYVTNTKLNKDLRRAHEDAVDDGHAIDSPGYFRFIESKLGISGQSSGASRRVDESANEPLSNASSAASRRTAPPAAPVNNSMSSDGSERGRVRLTRAEADAARLADLTPEQYYKNKMALQKEGRIKLN